jgi:two-component system CheB/CheR fusion protein
LQAAIEEFEEAKEAMRAANEELLSMNEELRSAAEELETSKEELQSMNEELVTVNQENRNKMEELNQLNSDLQNFLTATHIATLFLDRHLRIKRFTPKIGQLFNILPSDRGRPLAHLTHRLGYTNLVEDAAQVLKTLSPINQEIRSEGGEWHLTQLLPYRTVDDRIDGVVITFVDITPIKQAEEVLRQSEQQLQTLNTDLEERVNQRTAEVRRLASEVLVVEQKTMQRISQLLHDDLQQIIFSTQVQMTLLGRELADEGGERMQQVQDVTDTLNKALQVTRQVAFNLAPPVLQNQDFGDSLHWLTVYMKERYDLEVETEMASELGDLPEEVRIYLFQSIRELLFNVMKHAQTHRAAVKLFEEDGHLRVVVSDKGQGFDTAAFMANELSPSNGLGLSSMRGRMQLFGGDLYIKSQPGQGTEVTMMLRTEG